MRVFVRARREIARGDLSGRQQLFTTELLEWPGFVEFDEANEIILTYSSTDKSAHSTCDADIVASCSQLQRCSPSPLEHARVFKVWDQATYALHYQFADAAIQEVKIRCARPLQAPRTSSAVPARPSHGALLHILAPLTSEEAESSLNLRVMEAKRGEVRAAVACSQSARSVHRRPWRARAPPFRSW